MAQIEICPKFEKCPIYNREVSLLSEKTLEIYRRNYCMAGRENYTKCKRYIVAERIGKPAPVNILPNSTLTVEQIIEMMQKEENNEN